MEGQLFDRLYEVVTRLGKPRGSKQFSDAWIVMVFLWSAIWDRPRCWACDRRNWPEDQRWRDLPSQGTLSRRMRSVGVLGLLERAQCELRDLFPRRMTKLVDSKPLVVGGASKDRDAKAGRAVNGKARGYRIHVVWDDLRSVEDWRLAAMKENDKTVARELFAGRGLDDAAYVLADGQYDGNEMFDLVAARGARLLVQPREAYRRGEQKGLGHRRQSPHRLRSLELAGKPMGLDLLRGRGDAERGFGHLGNFGGGLGQLPNWVRRPRRVAAWVAAKLLIYHARRAIQQHLRRE